MKILKTLRIRSFILSLLIVSPHFSPLHTNAQTVGDVISVAWSPDGSKIASAGYDEINTLRVWDGSNYKPLAFRNVGTSFGVSWSPDGTQLAAAKINHYISILDVTLSTSRVLLGDAGGAAVAWSPDGNRIASSDVQGKIYVWCPATDDLEITFQEHTDIVDAVAWKPDSTALATAGRDGQVKVWNTATWELIVSFPRTPPFFTSIAWSPDGSKLAYGGTKGELHIVNVITDEAIATIEANRNAETSPAGHLQQRGIDAFNHLAPMQILI